MLFVINFWWFFVAPEYYLSTSLFCHGGRDIVQVVHTFQIDLSKFCFTEPGSNLAFTWVNEKFWNKSHVSLNIRWNYIKCIQSTKLLFFDLAMVSDWCRTHGGPWRHHLMTSCNRGLEKNMSEMFFSQRRAITNINVSFGSYFFEVKIDLIKHYKEQWLSKY